ncbi:iron-containing alcohol dehydrogenase [Cesiribacter andamanensis]|uniref:Alcohol dehydrogenase YqhD n=1 Tax=Cesiribacter andamanensis AMV16 TaxID=1279009 RepID=M7MZZ7_9BACT|nr:iron-containing alcohol dehydrogenase [Cesiribacter andamanensis]EMR02013.1 Alcohol dehydrogenase YqhD [Cesiribacter andamanensis AMV16]
MLNFEFKNPTKILFGKDQIAALAKEVPAQSKVLLLYGGGSIKKNGVYDQVKKALQQHQLLEFGGIEPNPEYKTLMKAVQLIKQEGIDFLLAVGGGSVIDGTKFISAAAVYPGDNSWDILARGIRTEKGMPFGSVLTLPATGSEMNSGAVINRSEIQEKRTMGGPGLFPVFSILDPQVVQSLPARQIQNGITDAFTHVLEQYLTYPIGALLQDRFAESILQTLVEVGPKVQKDPSDYTAAANFMWCCTMALNGLIQKGVPTDWATHMIAHELTALYGIDHARTLAIIAPNLYRYTFEDKKEKLAQYGERVWNITQGTLEEKAEAAIQKTVDFFHTLEIKTRLSDYTDAYEQTADIVYQRFEERGWKGLGERKKIGPDAARRIVELSY